MALSDRFVAAHAQMPAWTGLQLDNSKAIIIEAASRIASQHAQAAPQRHFVPGFSEVSVLHTQRHAHQSAHVSMQATSQNSFPKKSEASEKQQREGAVGHRLALGYADTLALRSLKKSDSCLATMSTFELLIS
jgi:hypothetical protein